ncbi:sigma-54 dependent transcriptional regulator [Flavihumibacter rivuli]|uniref:sigma-54-dependent transcriptional regulator n=1 Tax=Flavihumibacter rivuli TaxID=2838156 RepID=UPI001BDE2A6A|nr:sigma-54 dependent transcriptional regulator [Flavihumibacter rivuli]ULQ55100.1 sigma-54 dependent transcriptional regulator [Flavihumibacter rivuli]
MKSILIVDDELKLRQLYSRVIGMEGYQVLEAGNCKEAMKVLGGHGEIRVILTDVKLPDGNGIDLVPVIREKFPNAVVIVMTAYATIADGVEAMRRGAFDYLVKGDDNDKLIPVLARAFAFAELSSKVEQLEKKIGEPYHFDQIIGDSPAIKEAKQLARKVAPTEATVLLQGETGVGKELFAQAIHYASSRSKGNFVAINCSAFPADLLESELFGYAKGAFTGADKDKKGLFQEAHGGTLFLDEIGEMPMSLQAKLLRVLETMEFNRLGDSKPTKVDIRIIAATNRSLNRPEDTLNFRPDLYFRISAFTIQIPSLRDRLSDIEMLANQFLTRYNKANRKKIRSISKDALDCLRSYSWRGNVRELKNIIERAVILCEEDSLTINDLPADLKEAAADARESYSLANMEKLHIRKVLSLVKGNKTRAAELLGIGIATLYRKIEEYGL